MLCYLDLNVFEQNESEKEAFDLKNMYSIWKNYSMVINLYSNLNILRFYVLFCI